MASMAEVLQRTEATAAQMTPGRVAAGAAAWFFYAIGWSAAKLMVVFWRGFRFAATAVRVGWAETLGPSKRSVIEQQRQQIAEYKMRLSRFEG